MRTHLDSEGEKISKSTEEGLKRGVKKKEERKGKRSGTGIKKIKGKVRSTNKSNHPCLKPGVLLPSVVKSLALPPLLPLSV